jgi:sulfofructose kinase
LVDVIGFGEGSIDHVHVVAELPGAARSKARILSSYTAYGGQVATTMAACASLGMEAVHLGPVGNDGEAEALLQELSGRGVNVTRVIRRNAPTRFAILFVQESTGERFVWWARQDGLDVRPDELDRTHVAGARVVHLDATDPAAALRLAELASAAGALVTTDVDSASTETVRLLNAATVPIVAEHVPHEIAGEADLATALRRIRQPHQRTVCVTLGERGSAALDGDALVHVPAVPVHAVDTTGAGDVFRAGFIYGLVQAWPIRRILEFANTAAAVACTRFGAIQSIPTLMEVREFRA